MDTLTKVILFSLAFVLFYVALSFVRQFVATRDGGDSPRTVTPYGNPDASDARSRSAEGPGDGSTGTVTCPECGADNEPGYRFCRRCVTELRPAPYG